MSMICTIGNRACTVHDVALKLIDPLNPLDLPQYTMRLWYKTGVIPTFDYGTGVQLSEDPNIWDLTYEGTNWSVMFFSSRWDLLEVLGANTTGVTLMQNMFYECTSLRNVVLFDTSTVTETSNMFTECTHLTTVPLFDLSNVTNALQMFKSCYALTSVPLFDLSKVTNAGGMFKSCSLTNIPYFNLQSVRNVKEMFDGNSYVNNGILAMYQQLSALANIYNHESTFRNCGVNTTQGAAELAQIPDDWK